MTETKAILKIEDLTVSIQEKKIIDKLNIEVLQGEVHAIMGKNGSRSIFSHYCMDFSLQYLNVKFIDDLFFLDRNG